MKSRSWASKNIKNVPFDRLVKWLTKYKMYLCLIPTWFQLRNWSSLQMCHKLSQSRDGWKIRVRSKLEYFEILNPDFQRITSKWNRNLTQVDLFWPQMTFEKSLRWNFYHVVVRKNVFGTFSFKITSYITFDNK